MRSWAAVAMLALMAVFAVQSGEFSLWDYRELKRRVAEERAAEARLTQLVDSLRLLRKAVLTDPKVQERIAREQFGMIRAGEFLYKLTTPEEP